MRDDYEFAERGEIEVKGKVRRPAYLLVGRRSAKPEIAQPEIDPLPVRQRRT